MEIKAGDIYIHNSDGQICRVKWVDGRTVVLESEDGKHLRLTSTFSLEKEYSKKKPESLQSSSLLNPLKFWKE